ncbi:MAG: hypothetical protein JRN17_04710 [Nitrososphaerota archaeon]|nr:hypothetical protein [Nitrososphaerota archaeon]
MTLLGESEHGFRFERTPEWQASSHCMVVFEGWPDRDSFPRTNARYRPHTFRHPKTRSLTDDLQCWWCGKTYKEVREARNRERRER